jgi:hypothetical protein
VAYFIRLRIITHRQAVVDMALRSPDCFENGRGIMNGGMPHENVGGNEWDLWDRRDFMVGVGSLTALAVEPAAAVTPAIVVADSRIPASRAFAAEAARMGHRIAWTRGDITDLWYGELDLRWRTDRVVVAGLTEYGAFFCLERLAMDRGLHVAFRGEHRRVDSATMLHTICGPSATGLSDDRWPAQVARMAMTARPASPTVVRRATRSTADRTGLLVSWVLAPKRANA